jgi:hypothetical protein
MSDKQDEAIKCVDWSPVPCAYRRAARDRGDFGYLWGVGWVWWRAKDVMTPWEKCPWCDGWLPTMEALVLRALSRGK